MNKKYIFIILILLAFSTTYAQVACTLSNDPSLTNAVFIHPEDNQRIALDLNVPAGSQFTFASITTLIVSNNNNNLNPTADLEIFTNAANNTPGTSITTETVTPSNVTDLGTVATFTKFSVTFEFATPIILDNLTGTADAVYWVSFSMGNVGGTEVGLRAGSSSVEGNPLAIINPATGGVWVLDATNLDGSYTFSGVCLLSVDEFYKENIAIYPNPTNSIVNINVPKSVNITSVTLYNVLGKQVFISDSTKSIDLTNLQSGVYMLNVTTDSGSITKKIIRN